MAFTQIRADPADINVLDQYDKDPRVVTNLIDGIYRTRDDTHMWLAPYSKGKNHYIYMTFAKPVKIAMIRIWVSVYALCKIVILRGKLQESNCKTF